MSEKIPIAGVEFTKTTEEDLSTLLSHNFLFTSEVEQALREKDEKFKRFDNAYRLLEADYRKSQSQLAEKEKDEKFAMENRKYHQRILHLNTIIDGFRWREEVLKSQLAEKDERINDLKKELKINQGELEARAKELEGTWLIEKKSGG